MAAIWSDEEKRKLLCGLYQHGPADLEALHKLVPSKTQLEIKVLCEEHAKLALNKREDRSTSSSIKQWLQVLMRLKGSHTDQIHDLVPRVLKYIALFEKREPTRNIDLCECYLSLANMCRGLDPAKLDEPSKYFLYECLTKLAKCLKFGDCRLYKKHIASLHGVEDLHLHRKNPNSKIGRSLTLNPLGIPGDFLELNKLELSYK